VAYSDDAINLTLLNYWKGKRAERITLWDGDPVWEKLYDQMEGENPVKDHGRQFGFDVTYDTAVRTTQGGTGGDLNIGENGTTATRGTDARASTFATIAYQENDLIALEGQDQLADWMATTFLANGIQLQKWMAEQFLTGSNTDPDNGFGQLCTLNGGDGTAVTYTALDGTSRNGIISFQSEAAQVSAALSRHGISAGTVGRWVTRFVDNSAGSWAADTQTFNANELHMLCAEGCSAFTNGGKTVKQRAPNLGLCTFRGYNYYQRSLKAQERYAAGVERGQNINKGLVDRSGVGGGLMYGENTPLYYCRTFDSAVSGGTAFVGYGGILVFLNTQTWGVRYINNAGANPGSQRQHGRVWKWKHMPEELVKDRRVFKGSAEQQIFCWQLRANGGMKGWDQA
jgi:hypothetical protein